jgi:hypothetical protein
MILVMVFLTMGEKVELESKDYYAQELKYGQRMEAIRNAAIFNSEMESKLESSSIRILFPASQQGKAVQGKIVVYRPSDSGLDQSFPLNGRMPESKLLQSAKFIPGKYLVKAEWKCEGKDYYWEKEIIYQ